MMRNYIQNLVIVIALMIPLGCSDVLNLISLNEQKEPIIVKDYNLLPLNICDIHYNIIPGLIIGGHYDGIARIKQQHYLAPKNSDWSLNKKYLKILFEECSNAGYIVSLPEEGQFSFNNSNEILIAATIVDLKIKTFGELAGNYTEVSLLTLWEFFLTSNQQLIYSCSTNGQSNLTGIAIEQASLIAFKNCVRNVLSDSVLVNTFIKCKTENNWQQQFSFNN